MKKISIFWIVSALIAMAYVAYGFMVGRVDGASASIVTILCFAVLLSVLFAQKSKVARLALQVLLACIALECVAVFILGDAVTYATILSALFFLCASIISFVLMAKSRNAQPQKVSES